MPGAPLAAPADGLWLGEVDGLLGLADGFCDDWLLLDPVELCADDWLLLPVASCCAATHATETITTKLMNNIFRIEELLLIGLPAASAQRLLLESKWSTGFAMTLDFAGPAATLS